jgi:hypothetical protein
MLPGIAADGVSSLSVLSKSEQYCTAPAPRMAYFHFFVAGADAAVREKVDG